MNPIRRNMVMGFCIGGPFIWNLLKRAPDRVVAAVLAQPVGFRPEMPTMLYVLLLLGKAPPTRCFLSRSCRDSADRRRSQLLLEPANDHAFQLVFFLEHLGASPGVVVENKLGEFVLREPVGLGSKVGQAAEFGVAIFGARDKKDRDVRRGEELFDRR